MLVVLFGELGGACVWFCFFPREIVNSVICQCQAKLLLFTLWYKRVIKHRNEVKPYNKQCSLYFNHRYLVFKTKVFLSISSHCYS